MTDVAKIQMAMVVTVIEINLVLQEMNTDGGQNGQLRWY